MEVDDDEEEPNVELPTTIAAQAGAEVEENSGVSPTKKLRHESSQLSSRRGVTMVAETVVLTPLEYHRAIRQVDTLEVERFFNNLHAWRQHHGYSQDARQQRNNLYLGPLLRSMLTVFTDMPTRNRWQENWEDMDDKTLKEAILAWFAPGVRPGDQQSQDNIDLAIDSLFPVRLTNYGQCLHTDMLIALSERRTRCKHTLELHNHRWLVAPMEERRRWCLRLLQILFDLRITEKPTAGEALPKLEPQHIPKHLKNHPQMRLLMLMADVIRGKSNTFTNDQFWRRLRVDQSEIEDWKDPKRIASWTYERVISLISKIIEGLSELAGIMAMFGWDYQVVLSDQLSGQQQAVAAPPPPPVEFVPPPARQTDVVIPDTPQERARLWPDRSTKRRARSPPPPTTQPPTKSKKVAKECHCCGREGHMSRECFFATHPYANRDFRIRWIDSPMGLQYRQRTPTIRCLPPREDPQGNPINFRTAQEINKEVLKVGSMKHNKKGKNSENYLTLLREARLHGCLTNSTIQIDEYRWKIKTLIDTGASSSDYISSRVANLLKEKGLELLPSDTSDVAGAWTNSHCRIVGVIPNCTVILKSDTDQPIQIELHNVRIIDCHFDLIIGLPTIRKYDLTARLRELFVSDKVESLDKVLEDHISSIGNSPNWLNALTSQELSKFTNDTKQISRKHVIQYAKEDLLELLEDGDEFPEWKSDPTDILPTPNGTVDEASPIPLVTGETSFSRRLRKLLHKHQQVFSRTITKIPARVAPMKLIIDKDKNHLWKLGGQPRPQSIAKQEALRNQIEVMLQTGLIIRSQATAYSQVVMVPKPNGSWRFCVDYRLLNELLESMGWPIPNIDRLFSRLGSKRAKFFAVLDLTSGYHQVLLDEKTRWLAAFVTDFGVFEPVRLWMGIKSAPSYFQQKMTEVLHGLVYNCCEIYIDDIIIYGKDENEFLTSLDTVLTRLKAFGITLNPDKAKVGLTQLEYVGRVINQHGVTMSDEKIRRVVEFPLPATAKALKSFLGLVNYFRQHVKHFAITAHPLHEMLEGYITKMNRNHKLEWTEIQKKAFEDIKDAIRANPLLHFVDEKLPIFLATDASDYGIGAYLYQLRTDARGVSTEIPVSFLSQAMNKVQRRWSTIEKECYAIWYALKKWEHLLRDVHFTILTDHRNLKYLNTNTPKVVRWKLAIQDYDFTVQHIDGTANVVADAFSRLCNNDEGKEDLPLEVDSTRDRIDDEEEEPDRLCSLTSGICPCSINMNAFLCGVAELDSPECISRIEEVSKLHRPTVVVTGEQVVPTESIISTEVTRTTTSGSKSTSTNPGKRDCSTQTGPEVHNLYSREITTDEHAKISEVHNNFFGHMGLHLTMLRLKARGYHWPNMRQAVHKYITSCPTCQKLRALTPAIRALPYVTGAPEPMERLSIDTMGPFTKSAQGFEHILVVIDNFSRFVELYPLHTVKADEAAQRLLEHVGRYGQPSQILSDGGTQFVNDTVKALNDLLHTNSIVSTPYSKQENGIVERANKEVLRHLRAFITDEKVLEAWHSYLPLVQRIMNSTRHSSLGVSPGEIMFGNATRLEPRVLSNLPSENVNGQDGSPLPIHQKASPTLRAWLDNMLAVQARIIKIAKDIQMETQQKHVKENLPNEIDSPFEPGEYVICDYADTGFGKQPPNKLLTPIRGPYRVVKYELNRYTLQHLDDNKTFLVDASKVRKFNFDPNVTNPVDVALQDRQKFYVEAIHGVRGDPSKRSTLSFEVEWTGYTERTWEPWTHLRKNIILHQYLSKSSNHHLRKLANSQIIQQADVN